MRPTQPRIRRTRTLTILVALAALTTVAAGCDVARVGQRCRSGFARDNAYVLQCRNGRWARLMTFGQYLTLMAQLQSTTTTIASAPAPPPPTTAPPATIPVRCTQRGFGVDLSGCDLRGAVLAGVDLTAANLRGANLSGVDLNGTALAGADVANAVIEGAALGGADLSSIRSGGLVGTPANLPPSVVLRVGYLVGPKADLASAVLNSTSLAGLNLSGARLTGAALGGVDASGTDFTGADFTGADLSTAAGPASLVNATLTYANFTSADISGVVYTGAVFKYTTCPNGSTQITGPQTFANC